MQGRGLFYPKSEFFNQKWIASAAVSKRDENAGGQEGTNKHMIHTCFLLRSNDQTRSWHSRRTVLVHQCDVHVDWLHRSRGMLCAVRGPGQKLAEATLTFTVALEGGTKGDTWGSGIKYPPYFGVATSTAEDTAVLSVEVCTLWGRQLAVVRAENYGTG